MVKTLGITLPPFLLVFLICFDVLFLVFGLPYREWTQELDLSKNTQWHKPRIHKYTTPSLHMRVRANVHVCACYCNLRFLPIKCILYDIASNHNDDMPRAVPHSRIPHATTLALRVCCCHFCDCAWVSTPPPYAGVQITRAHTNGEGQNSRRPHTWIMTRALVWFYTFVYTIFCWRIPAGTVWELG